MKKVFVKPEMKSHKLRSGNLLSASGCLTEEDVGKVCIPEMNDCKPRFGCGFETNSATEYEE